MLYGIVFDFTNKDLILPTKFVHLFHFKDFIKDLTHLTSKHSVIVITKIAISLILVNVGTPYCFHHHRCF